MSKQRGMTKQELERLINRVAEGNRSLFARMLGVPVRQVFGYLAEDHAVPWLSTLLLRLLADGTISMKDLRRVQR